ncbi:sensor histidine kinase [Chitinibacteraceae bacterium HSL-7]
MRRLCRSWPRCWKGLPIEQHELTDEAAPVTGSVFWRSLSLFNGFRLLALVVLALSLGWASSELLIPRFHSVFWQLCGIYLLLIFGFAAGIRLRRPTFEIQLTGQVIADIVFLVTLIHIIDGSRPGLGVLLLSYLAAAGLIAHGRMTLFHAALASIALLIEQGVRVAQGMSGSDSFANTAALCLASFAVAWLAHRLARYARESAQLASERGRDLAALGRVNARILQDVSDGVLVVDPVGRMTRCNEQAVRLIGPACSTGSSLAAVAPVLARALAGWRDYPSGPVPLLQMPVTRKTLRPRFVAASNDVAGDVLVYLEDMDRLRREAQQLKLAALGRLTANLAHEIRNPLGAISHASQLLAEEHIDDPLSKRLTAIIADNTLRLERMVADVLELNRRDRVDRQTIVLGEWLRQFAEETTAASAEPVQFSIVCPEGARVRFDNGHLHQVLWNLLRNGWRYCRKQADSLAVTVSAHADGGWQLDVVNDGPPVPDDAQSQLFEPFFTTDSKGTGLGLYIAREICAANAASLEYVSVPDGACFRMVFEDNEKNTRN